MTASRINAEAIIIASAVSPCNKHVPTGGVQGLQFPPAIRALLGLIIFFMYTGKTVAELVALPCDGCSSPKPCAFPPQQQTTHWTASWRSRTFQFANEESGFGVYRVRLQYYRHSLVVAECNPCWSLEGPNKCDLVCILPIDTPTDEFTHN